MQKHPLPLRMGILGFGIHNGATCTKDPLGATSNLFLHHNLNNPVLICLPLNFNQIIHHSLGSNICHLFCSSRTSGIHQYHTRMVMQGAAREGTWVQSLPCLVCIELSINGVTIKIGEVKSFSLLMVWQLFSGEPLFSHSELMKGEKLYVFPDVHSPDLL